MTPNNKIEQKAKPTEGKTGPLNESSRSKQETSVATKVTPKSESPGQGTRKFYKLSQKVLPFASLDTDLEGSIEINGGEQKSVDRGPAKESDAKNSQRSKSENRRDAAGSGGCKVKMRDMMIDKFGGFGKH